VPVKISKKKKEVSGILASKISLLPCAMMAPMLNVDISQGGSPSFMPNNLTSSDSTGQLAYIRLNEVAVVDLQRGADVTRVNIFNGRTTIYQVAYVNIKVSSIKLTYLVICTRLGVQLWSDSGERMIYFCPVNSLNGLEEENMHFMQGIAAGGSNVYIGTSMGTLLVFGSDRIDEFNLNNKIPTSNSCITALAFVDNTVACGNDDGDIFLFHTSDYHSLGVCEGKGFSVLTMSMTSQLIISGYICIIPLSPTTTSLTHLFAQVQLRSYSYL
jgi:hypothetical protein